VAGHRNGPAVVGAFVVVVVVVFVAAVVVVASVVAVGGNVVTFPVVAGASVWFLTPMLGVQLVASPKPATSSSQIIS
jgi:hypothetical protein